MKYQNRYNTSEFNDKQSSNKGEFSMKNIINSQKREKEKRLKMLKDEIIKQEKVLLDNKKKLEEKEKRNSALNSENQLRKIS